MSEIINPECNGVFEKIIAGELPSYMLYWSGVHRAGLVLDQKQVSHGHTLIILEDCAPRIEDLPPVRRRVLSELVSIMGERILVGYGDQELSYVAELKTGHQVRHPHKHSVPVFEEEGTLWLDRFSGAEPRLEPSEKRFSEAAQRLEFTHEWGKLVEDRLDEVEPDPEFDSRYFRSSEGLFVPGS